MSETSTEAPPEATGDPLPDEAAGLTPEPDVEPDGPETGADEPVDGGEGEPETSDVIEPAGLRDQKEIDAAFDKVGREHERHQDRLKVILGDDFDSLATCPLCSHFADGYIGLVELPEQAIPSIRALLGMPDLTTFIAAEDARTCPRCQGRGDVLTGSSVPGYETKQCSGCNGIGWVGQGAPVVAVPTDNGQETALTTTVTGPTVYSADPEDPQVAGLRERGFTVIPPMRLSTD